METRIRLKTTEEPLEEIVLNGKTLSENHSTSWYSIDENQLNNPYESILNRIIKQAKKEKDESNAKHLYQKAYLFAEEHNLNSDRIQNALNQLKNSLTTTKQSPSVTKKHQEFNEKSYSKLLNNYHLYFIYACLIGGGILLLDVLGISFLGEFNLEITWWNVLLLLIAHVLLYPQYTYRDRKLSSRLVGIYLLIFIPLVLNFSYLFKYLVIIDGFFLFLSDAYERQKSKHFTSNSIFGAALTILIIVVSFGIDKLLIHVLWQVLVILLTVIFIRFTYLFDRRILGMIYTIFFLNLYAFMVGEWHILMIGGFLLLCLVSFSWGIKTILTVDNNKRLLIIPIVGIIFNLFWGFVYTMGAIKGLI